MGDLRRVEEDEVSGDASGDDAHPHRGDGAMTQGGGEEEAAVEAEGDVRQLDAGVHPEPRPVGGAHRRPHVAHLRRHSGGEVTHLVARPGGGEAHRTSRATQHVMIAYVCNWLIMTYLYI